MLAWLSSQLKDDVTRKEKKNWLHFKSSKKQLSKRHPRPKAALWRRTKTLKFLQRNLKITSPIDNILLFPLLQQRVLLVNGQIFNPELRSRALLNRCTRRTDWNPPKSSLAGACIFWCEGPLLLYFLPCWDDHFLGWRTWDQTRDVFHLLNYNCIDKTCNLITQ